LFLHLSGEKAPYSVDPDRQSWDCGQKTGCRS